MITVADLDRVLSMMQQHGLQSLRVREGQTLLALRLSENGGPARTARREASVCTKAIGRLLLRHPQREAAEVSIGDKVSAQTIIGFLESGHVLLPILAGKAGEVLRFEAGEGDLLGYGAPVLTLLVEP